MLNHYSGGDFEPVQIYFQFGKLIVVRPCRPVPPLSSGNQPLAVSLHTARLQYPEP